MKRSLLITAIPALALLVSGCPVGLDYPLDVPGKSKADKELVGTWVNQASDAEVLKVSIKKDGDNAFQVEVLERGEMYALETDNLQGWTTTLNKASFVYFKPEGEEKYYHYCYSFDGNDLVTHDVALLDGGVDAVTSIESLREQVESSMEKEDWGKEKQIWSKE